MSPACVAQHHLHVNGQHAIVDVGVNGVRASILRQGEGPAGHSTTHADSHVNGPRHSSTLCHNHWPEEQLPPMASVPAIYISVAADAAITGDGY
jgi:hypothetical protein